MKEWFEYWKQFNRPVVLGEGSPTAPWWIVGEALGEQEEENGKPFYPEAPAGSLFRSVLKQAHLENANIFITNIFPIRPPGNKVDRLREYGVDLDEAGKKFKDFLNRSGPKRTLALGNIPMGTICALAGIEEWRGSPVNMGKGWCIPSLHPSNIQRKFDTAAKKEERGQSKYTYGSGRMSLVLDMVKCFTWPDLSPPSITVHTEYEPGEALDKLKEWIAKPRPLTFDIETKGTYIDIIGFADSPHEAWVFPMQRASWREHYELFQIYLRELLLTPYLIGQNAAFDRSMLIHSGYECAPVWFDTRIAQSWIYPDLPGDLHYMVSIYTTHPHYKWMVTTNRMKYNGLDCALTFKVYEELERRINKMEKEERE